ncbi:P1 family peptidase [Arenibaculum pallidiluteum]|uniref:P1 family peptidase n=1 Tax=Arenibaculum pallidiluteum TaxID=2812559 RepID=UPI001A956C34|nr:P1 family peptidase [Arenibaculum pallidiluteum]
MTAPGARNLLTDVDGLLVGNAGDAALRSGVTVVLPERPCVAAVDVRGGAPGTRETDALDPACWVDRVDALVLSGGSAFGLDAAQGAMAWLAARGRGFPVGSVRVPIVPAAILFDLLNGGDKDWGDARPYDALARRACEAAGPAFDLGNQGAGLGAKAGALKGGLGSASAVCPDGLQVGALIAANPVGSVVVPGTGTFWAWMLEQDGEMGFQRPPAGPIPMAAGIERPQGARLGGNTTIGVVATNARLSKAEAQRLAIMAQDGLARAIRPVHTPFDGDTIFALATGTAELPTEPTGDRAAALYRLGTLAADCAARAVARGVFAAGTLGPWPAYRERHAGAFGAAPGRAPLPEP